jgi:hypothetical protein
MPRLKGRTYRQASPQRAEERHAQIREQLRAGVQDPAAIAKAVQLSKEAVLYHARRMPDVRCAYDSANRRRITLHLLLAEAAA